MAICTLEEMAKMDKLTKDFYDTIDFEEMFLPRENGVDIEEIMSDIKDYYDERNPDLLPPEFEGYFFNFCDKGEFSDYLKKRYNIKIVEEITYRLYWE